MTLRSVTTILLGTLTSLAITGWTAEPSLPGIRVVALNVPAEGKAGFTLLRPEQTGLTFTNSLLQVASASTGACGVVSTTVVADPSTFDAELQNEVCNSSSPCDFGRIIAPPASIAFASSALANPPANGDFRVARITFCAAAQGTARLHWQFSPPAPGTPSCWRTCSRPTTSTR